MGRRPKKTQGIFTLYIYIYHLHRFSWLTLHEKGYCHAPVNLPQPHGRYLLTYITELEQHSLDYNKLLNLPSVFWEILVTSKIKHFLISYLSNSLVSLRATADKRRPLTALQYSDDTVWASVCATVLPKSAHTWL